MGGLETALLIGAATGAGTSAITGGDPLKGALFGALGGAVMPGIGQALGGQAAGTAAATAGSTAASTAANVGANLVDDFALAGTKVPFGSTGVPTQFGSLDRLTALSPSSAGASTFGANIGTSPYSLTASGVPSNTVGGSLLPQTAGNVVPQTGFMDIFKSTPGGPEFGQRVGNYIVQNPASAAMSGSSLANTLFNPNRFELPSDEYDGPLKRYRFNPDTYRPAFAGGGGITDIDLGSTARLTGTPVTMMARGGIADLGGYSDGGRLLKGPGDGMSDSIPARIGRRQPARLADGEFVVPADVVSHLGNGSTDAGAKQLYDMMDKVRRARTGNKKQGREINPRKFVPA